MRKYPAVQLKETPSIVPNIKMSNLILHPASYVSLHIIFSWSFYLHLSIT